jgi:hypothetical protein
MIMPRILAFAVILLPFAASATAPHPDPGVGKGCFNRGPELAVGQPDPGGFRRLDQLPPANEFLTVIRMEDGCMKPVIVRYNIGGNPSLAK